MVESVSSTLGLVHLRFAICYLLSGAITGRDEFPLVRVSSSPACAPVSLERAGARLYRYVTVPGVSL